MTSEQQKDLEVAALSMGYRRLRADKLSWAKPFAFSLICIDGEKEPPEFFQVFRSAKDNSIGVWSVEKLHFDSKQEHGTILDQIKHHESYHTHEFSATDGNFHFLDLGLELEVMGWL